MNHRLGYSSSTAKPAEVSNQRNGKSAKTVLIEDGPIRIEAPRDRDGSFQPLLIPKHERRFTGFDGKIVAMYARGMTVREIQAFLLVQYGTAVSPDFINSVTDEVMAEVAASVCDDVSFRSKLSPICRAGTRFSWPPGAGDSDSIEARPLPIDLDVLAQPTKHRQMQLLPHTSGLPVPYTTRAVRIVVTVRLLSSRSDRARRNPIPRALCHSGTVCVFPSTLDCRSWKQCIHALGRWK